MAADTTVDLIINQKSTFDVTFAVKDEGVAINLTGYTVDAKLKPEYSAPDSQSVTFTTAIANAVAGTISMSLSPAQTTLLTLPRYYYDMTITSNSGFKTRVVEGKITISKGIT